MAWGSNTNPVEIGAATRKVDYDDLWDKLQYVKDSVMPAATKMLFGQSSAPTGWTKDTSTWTDKSMIVFTTGSIGSGGTDDPTAQAATYTLASGGSSGHTAVGGDEVVKGASSLVVGTSTGTAQLATDTTGGPSANLRYQSVIAATKDAYT